MAGVKKRHFDSQLTFGCDLDLHEKLIALSYLGGTRGHYAHVARNLLTKAVEEKIESLEGGDLRRYKVLIESAKAYVKIGFDLHKAKGKRTPYT